MINDNDFGVAQIVIDNATGRFTRAPGYEPGARHARLDRRAGIGRVRSRFGDQHPPRGRCTACICRTAIAAYKAKGRTYLVTANEGDARDWPGFAEEARVSALTLDPGAFPDTTIKANANLGRHTVTRTLGDANGDGFYEALYTLGGRSFSIWSAEGSLVYDSGSDFERITASAAPGVLQCEQRQQQLRRSLGQQGTRTGRRRDRRDRRSHLRIHRARARRRRDDVRHHRIHARRSSSTISTIATSQPATGDLGPEGLTFISAHDSPEWPAAARRRE